jgi:hypothetical protein
LFSLYHVRAPSTLTERAPLHAGHSPLSARFPSWISKGSRLSSRDVAPAVLLEPACTPPRAVSSSYSRAGGMETEPPALWQHQPGGGIQPARGHPHPDDAGRAFMMGGSGVEADHHGSEANPCDG